MMNGLNDLIRFYPDGAAGGGKGPTGAGDAGGDPNMKPTDAGSDESSPDGLTIEQLKAKVAELVQDRNKHKAKARENADAQKRLDELTKAQQDAADKKLIEEKKFQELIDQLKPAKEQAELELKTYRDFVEGSVKRQLESVPESVRDKVSKILSVAKSPLEQLTLLESLNEIKPVLPTGTPDRDAMTGAGKPSEAVLRQQYETLLKKGDAASIGKALVMKRQHPKLFA